MKNPIQIEFMKIINSVKKNKTKQVSYPIIGKKKKKIKKNKTNKQTKNIKI